MNDKKKRIAAIAGIVLLLAAAILPMIGAFAGKSFFLISLVFAIAVPILAWAMLMVTRVLKGQKEEVIRNNPIRNVVFDVGKVLVHFEAGEYLESLDYDPETKRAIGDAVFYSDTWIDRDRGEKSEEEYERAFIANDPAHEKEIRQVLSCVENAVQKKDYAKTWVKLLKDRGFHVYVLSNLSLYLKEHCREAMSFRSDLDGEVYSCDVHLLKPDAAIYEAFLAKYGLKAQSCVFIDDREENCEAAERIGMKAIHFRDFKHTAPELDRLLGLDQAVL